MSIKALSNISHNGTIYSHGEIITDITKEEAQRLMDLNIAKLYDDKFKKPKVNLKTKIALQNKRANNKEEHAYASG